jgi:hypothetical protein
MWTYPERRPRPCIRSLLFIFAEFVIPGQLHSWIFSENHCPRIPAGMNMGKRESLGSVRLQGAKEERDCRGRRKIGKKNIFL